MMTTHTTLPPLALPYGSSRPGTHETTNLRAPLPEDSSAAMLLDDLRYILSGAYAAPGAVQAEPEDAR